jgi:hypothetical protein
MKSLLYFSLLGGLILLPLSTLAGDNRPKPAADKDKPADALPADAAADQTDDDKAADAAPPEPRKVSCRPTAINVIPDASGLKTLAIHFRWALYPDSSIEVRLVPGKPSKKLKATPIYFHEHLKGRVQEEFFKCLDHPENSGRTYSFTDDKIVYKMMGLRNSLGNQGIHVQVYKEDTDPAKDPAAAFLQMDTWAVDKETLCIDLPRDEFAKPGTLFVWFFRGDDNVWEEQLLWPGYK